MIKDEDYEEDFRLSDRPWDEETMGNRETTKREIYQRLKRSTASPFSLKRILVKWKAAAAILVILMLPAAYYIWLNPGEKPPVLADSTFDPLKNDVAPGGNKARLQLGDGSVLVLEEAKNGTVKKEGNTIINKNERQLIYQASGIPAEEEIAYNTITTPRGGQFQVILPDGTHVWLNAASSLRFPTVFTGAERRVELRGEGYFEVARDDNTPFKVITGAMEVEVLGTHFNINAYQDEKSIRTTLLEGAVKVRNGNDKILLKPGQQALLNKNAGNMLAAPANTEAVVAWKNEYFQFDNEDIFSIMRKLSRWYDVEVEYGKQLSGKNFSGAISRFENISEVLAMLELTGVVHFKIEGRRITVMP